MGALPKVGDLLAVRKGAHLFAQSRNRVWWNLHTERSSDGIYTEFLNAGDLLVFLGEDRRSVQPNNLISEFRQFVFFHLRTGRTLNASTGGANGYAVFRLTETVSVL